MNVKANKLRPSYEKQDDHQFLYQVVYDDTVDAASIQCMNIIYGTKYVYKSTLDSQIGNRLMMIPCDNPLIASSHLPVKLDTDMNTNKIHCTREHENDAVKTNYKLQMQGIIQNEIYLNSHFGRLICAILFYQGFEKSNQLIIDKHELASCIFVSYPNKFSFNQILVSLAMSIIEREYDRNIIEFPSSKQLANDITQVITNENNPRNDHGLDQNHWFYLLIQSLYEYIDSKFWSSFPWCGCTTKAKQRHKLLEIFNDLYSLSTIEIPKNKEIYPTLKILRLQKLANIQISSSR